MRNLKMVIEYDGRGYHGWQRQKNGLSIQQVLEEKIAVITGEKVTVSGSGRTDAGVHALGQVAHFKTACGIPADNLWKGINSLLPADIVLKSLEEADEDYHARIDAKGKVYLYQIFNSPTRTVLYRHYAWIIHCPLDIDLMRKAAVSLIGRHDFTSFSSVHTDVISFEREIKRIDILNYLSVEHPLIKIFVEADGFLRYMVRTIVGTLVEVGRGKRPPEDVAAVLKGRDRKLAGMTAPPQGLFLKEVLY
ncbi:MAG: tRNA pseudouridine(38-40) synthase TruA [Deltaproteobacteria bacterium]|nr:tRNA pseudouridine(38-40) synthase TruA [Deltaproteobacteria bacterium]